MYKNHMNHSQFNSHDIFDVCYRKLRDRDFSLWTCDDKFVLFWGILPWNMVMRIFITENVFMLSLRLMHTEPKGDVLEWCNTMILLLFWKQFLFQTTDQFICCHNELFFTPSGSKLNTKNDHHIRIINRNVNLYVNLSF